MTNRTGYVIFILVFGEIPKEVSTNEVFKALSDPTRREILRFLRDREHTAGELADYFSLAKSTLSGHFAVLKSADLIEQEKRGTTIFYRLNATIFQEMLLHLLELFGTGQTKEISSSAALSPLREMVETPSSKSKGEL